MSRATPLTDWNRVAPGADPFKLPGRFPGAGKGLTSPYRAKEPGPTLFRTKSQGQIRRSVQRSKQAKGDGKALTSQVQDRRTFSCIREKGR